MLVTFYLCSLFLVSFLTFCSGNDLDWSTYGVSNTRASINKKEYIISASSASHLKQKWVINFPNPLIAQAVVAVDLDMSLSPVRRNIRGLKTSDGWKPPLQPHRNGKIPGERNRTCTDNKATRTLAYTGDVGGNFYAIDVDEGCVLWRAALGAYVDANCGDLPAFGLTGSAVFDRSTNIIYSLSGTGTFYALSMQTGAVVWSIPGAYDQSVYFSYGSLLLYNNNIYYTLASRCDMGSYQGGVSFVSLASKTVSTYSFRPSGTYLGGGVWGLGGVTMNDALSSKPIIYTPTGNSLGAPTENTLYCEQIVGLNLDMSLAGNAPVPFNSLGEPNDNDFGSTALFFNGPSESRVNQCPRSLVAAGRKDGFYFIIDANTYAIIQTIETQTSWQMMDYVYQGAWDEDSSTLVIPVYGNASGTTEGLSAYTLGSDCQLKLKWHTYVYHVYTPSIAGPPGNRIVAVGGVFQVFVLDLQTGKILFQPRVGGFSMNAPSITNGVMLYSVFDPGYLYAYNISGAVPTMSPTQSLKVPSLTPTRKPTSPTKKPSQAPSPEPTLAPTFSPTLKPTSAPTFNPSTTKPSAIPNVSPTQVPSSALPSSIPWSNPSLTPSQSPSLRPTYLPTFSPTLRPSPSPTLKPSIPPSYEPSSKNPTLVPTLKPSRDPTFKPSANPSAVSTLKLTNLPTVESVVDGSSTVPTNAPQAPSVNSAQNASAGSSSSSMSSTTIAIIASIVIVFFLILLSAVIYMYFSRSRSQAQSEKATRNMEAWNQEGQKESSEISINQS